MSRRSPKKGQAAQQMREQAHVLQARVDALESFIAGAPARREAYGLRNRDTLPAPDNLRRRAGRQVALGAQVLERRARERWHFFQFMMLLAVWVSVVIWLWSVWMQP